MTNDTFNTYFDIANQNIAASKDASKELENMTTATKTFTQDVTEVCYQISRWSVITALTAAQMAIMAGLGARKIWDDNDCSQRLLDAASTAINFAVHVYNTRGQRGIDAVELAVDVYEYATDKAATVRDFAAEKGLTLFGYAAAILSLAILGGGLLAYATSDAGMVVRNAADDLSTAATNVIRFAIG